jgi:hypothetical protein
MKFLEQKTTVVVVRVPDEIGAYRIFETLNDRGLRASQADILKNYFFSKSASRLSEAQMMWNTIATSVEALGGDENDRLITYLRHFWVTTHGPTKDRELAAQIKEEISGETKTLRFLSDAAAAVQDYVALWSSKHPKWSAYRASTRQAIETMAAHLKVQQIRPLMFAVSRLFTPDEADKAFNLFVSWSVRFLVYGGRGGMLDTQYSLRAQEVGKKNIKTARDLRRAMERYVPSDSEFQQAFAAARVSRSSFASYYLRSLERTLQGDKRPEFVASENTEDVNLEHVMPLTPGAGWNVKPDVAQTAQRLLGNMALLQSDKNTDLGNSSFAVKKKVYAKSAFKLTAEIADYSKWTMSEIESRQQKMAKLALKTWPLKFGK